MEVIVIFIALFASVFGVLYMYYTTRNKERMALIEKGTDAKLFNMKDPNLLSQKSRNTAFKFTLKFGAFLIGIGIGVILGAILEARSSMPEPPAYISMIMLGGGIGLVSSFYLGRHIDRKDEEREKSNA